MLHHGILISCVMATHHAEPLINSTDDVTIMSNIKLVVNRGQGPDFIFSVPIRFERKLVAVLHLVCN